MRGEPLQTNHQHIDVVFNFVVLCQIMNGCTMPIAEPRVVRALGEMLRSLNQDHEELPTVVIATTCRPDDVGSDLAAMFLHHLAIPVSLS